MPIAKNLLAILCCPETKTDIQPLADSDLKKLNDKIQMGKIFYKNGDKVEESLQEGLITTDNKTVYRIDAEIPIMLINKGISFDQV